MTARPWRPKGLSHDHRHHLDRHQKAAFKRRFPLGQIGGYYAYADEGQQRKLGVKILERSDQRLLVTTSGVNDTAALLCTMSLMGADRILFAVDYPYQRNEAAVEFIDTAPISDHDRDLICHRNAERILKLKQVEVIQEDVPGPWWPSIERIGRSRSRQAHPRRAVEDRVTGRVRSTFGAQQQPVSPVAAVAAEARGR